MESLFTWNFGVIFSTDWDWRQLHKFYALQIFSTIIFSGRLTRQRDPDSYLVRSVRQKVAEFDKRQKDAHERPEGHVEHENALFPRSWDPAHNFVVLLTRIVDAVSPNAGSLKIQWDQAVTIRFFLGCSQNRNLKTNKLLFYFNFVLIIKTSCLSVNNVQKKGFPPQ